MQERTGRIETVQTVGHQKPEQANCLLWLRTKDILLSFGSQLHSHGLNWTNPTFNTTEEIILLLRQSKGVKLASYVVYKLQMSVCDTVYVFK